MQQFECLRLAIDGAVARITLDRPDAANALNLTLARELAQAALICDNDKSVKVVLLTGTGRMFCAGGDLKAFVAFGDQAGAKIKELADELHKAISLFARMPAVVVIAVNGIAAGAGFSLAVTGDYVLAAESAKFTMAYTRTGLSPDGSSTYFMPRLIGLRRTQELMLTNRTLSAREALDWGLVTRVVPDESLQEEALAIATQLAAGPGGAHSSIKKLLLGALRNGLEEQMELEGRDIASAAVSDDGAEGIRAFVEKRKPRFQ
jgi:2-(1,2-epoxy-1,2-dihydrophenyl)acetyl-CoA isomerase